MTLVAKCSVGVAKNSEPWPPKCYGVFIGKIFIRKCQSKYLSMGWLKAAYHTYSIDGFLAVSFVK